MAETATNIYKNQKLKTGLKLMLGKDTTWWRILEVDEEKNQILVISEKAVCRKAYNEKSGQITWENCTLRKWLNEEYLYTEFSNEEQEAIIMSHLENSDNPLRGTDGGGDTEDNIFLLSIDEARQYFENEETRSICSLWWLRSPGSYSDSAALVDCMGNVYPCGIIVDINLAIRPALRLDLTSDIFKPLSIGFDGDI